MSSGQLVLDASIILKWALPGEEPGRQKAMELLEQWGQNTVFLAEPSIWLYEAGNILALKAPDQAERQLLSLIKLGIPTLEVNASRVPGILAITKQIEGVTFYDAAYHALAIELGATLLTADKKYFKLASGLGAIELLEV